MRVHALHMLQMCWHMDTHAKKRKKNALHTRTALVAWARFTASRSERAALPPPAILQDGCLLAAHITERPQTAIKTDVLHWLCMGRGRERGEGEK